MNRTAPHLPLDPRQRGFTIFEVVLAAAFVALGVLLVTETLGRTQGAAEADGAKSKAVLNGDKLLRRLTVELTQSTSQVDNTLPPEASQRLWLNADGITFQKVNGYEVQPDDAVTPRWSPKITYRWNADEGTIVRQVEGDSAQLLVRGVVQFTTEMAEGGQVAVTVVTRSGNANRGTSAVHRRTVRVTPRNALN